MIFYTNYQGTITNFKCFDNTKIIICVKQSKKMSNFVYFDLQKNYQI